MNKYVNRSIKSSPQSTTVIVAHRY
jgi:hypothetical protein